MVDNLSEVQAVFIAYTIHFVKYAEHQFLGMLVAQRLTIFIEARGQRKVVDAIYGTQLTVFALVVNVAVVVLQQVVGLGQQVVGEISGPGIGIKGGKELEVACKVLLSLCALHLLHFAESLVGLVVIVGGEV